MDDARIQALIDELDRLAPRDDAIVRLQDATDDDRRVLEVEGNRAGFVQLGLVFLRAAFAPSVTPRPQGEEIYADRPEILDEESGLEFGEFRRWQEPPASHRHEEKTLTGLATSIGCLVGGGAVLVVFLAGLFKLAETLFPFTR